jgi:hypothetical protein
MTSPLGFPAPKLFSELSGFLERLSPGLIQILSSSGADESALLKSLNIGQVLRGEILDIFANGQVSLNLDGTNVLANIEGPTAIGQSIEARIEQVRPQVLLRQISPQTSPAPKEQVANEVFVRPSGISENGKRMNAERFSPFADAERRESADNLLDTTDRQRPRSVFDAGVQSKRYEGSRSIFEGGVQGKVVEVAQKDSVVVDVDGHRVVAKVEPGMEKPAPGAIVTLQIKNPADGLVATVVNDSLADSSALAPEVLMRAHILAQKPFSEVLAQFQGALSGFVEFLREGKTDATIVEKIMQTLNVLMSAAETSPGDENQLQRQVDLSGINYEAKVMQALMTDEGQAAARAGLSSDFKGQLLELKKTLENLLADTSGNVSAERKERVGEMAYHLRGVLDHIEAQQIANHSAKLENQPLLLQIPVPFLAGDKTLKVYYRQAGSGKDNKKKDDYFLVLLLELQGIGPLRVDVRVEQKRLAITFYTNRESVLPYINQELKSLTDRLQGLGYEVQAVCRAQVKENDFGEPVRQVYKSEIPRLLDIKT